MILRVKLLVPIGSGNHGNRPFTGENMGDTIFLNFIFPTLYNTIITK